MRLGTTRALLLLSTAAALGALVACGNGNDEEEDDDDGGDAVTYDPAGDAENAPVVTDCDASCRLHTTGDQFYQWSMECFYEDPQGNATVFKEGELEVFHNGDGIVVTALAAVDGRAFTSFAEDALAVLVQCTNAASYEFEFRVFDEDGNTGTGSAIGRFEG